MGKQVGVFLAIVMLCAMAAWLLAPPPPPVTVWDYAVDGWTLETSIEQVRAKLGPPDRQDVSGDGLVTTWREGLVLGTDPRGKRARFVMGKTLLCRGQVVGRALDGERGFVARVGGVGGGLVLREGGVEVGYDVRDLVVERFWVRRGGH
jgi:hypothetical protein